MCSETCLSVEPLLPRSLAGAPLNAMLFRCTQSSRKATIRLSRSTAACDTAPICHRILKHFAGIRRSREIYRSGIQVRKHAQESTRANSAYAQESTGTYRAYAFSSLPARSLAKANRQHHRSSTQRFEGVVVLMEGMLRYVLNGGVVR